MDSGKRDYCIRSEECNVLAGFYKTIMDEKRKMLWIISEKYGISYDELVLKYIPTSVKFGDDTYGSNVF